MLMLLNSTVLHAQSKLEFGKSYYFVTDVPISPSNSAGVVAAAAVPINAPANSIFRVVDTLANGDAVIRFWKWPVGDMRRSTFNYQDGDSTHTAFFHVLPKAGQNKTRPQTPRSSTNGQAPIDAPTAPLIVDPLHLDTARLTLARDRSFIYSIGTNFDFIDNLQTEKTYHDLRIWVPNLAKDTSKWYAPFGFEFTFNRFRTFSTPDSSERVFRDVDSRLVADDGDTVLVMSFLTNTVEDKVISRFDNLGLSFNPFFRLTKGDRKDVVVAATGLLEWQRSVLTRTTTRTFNEVSTDEVPEDWEIPYQLDYDLPPAQEVIRTTTDNFYGGGGFRLLYRDDYGTLNMRVGAGYCYTLIANGDGLTTREAPFYLLQAEIIESKVSGIKIGTEIRGFFIDGPTDADLSLPRFNLYIAKEFQLKKIADLLAK